MGGNWLEGTKQERRMERGKKDNRPEKQNDNVNSKVGFMKKTLEC